MLHAARIEEVLGRHGARGQHNSADEGWDTPELGPAARQEALPQGC